jgi:DNA gyrase subunit A
VRVFQSRNSVGVRGIAMAATDRVISMAVIEHVDAPPAERAAYLKRVVAERRLAAGIAAGEDEDIQLTNEEVGEETELSDERYEFLKAHEQFVLTVTEYGYGKRSSSYDFRLTGRGGKGIRATDVSKAAEIGRLVATFPVGNDDQIMLVSDGGTVIRVPVNGIRFASRATKGVTIFNTADGEKVVSVERISEPQSDEEAEEIVEDAGPDAGAEGAGPDNNAE